MLVYATGEDQAQDLLVWVDRTGRATSLDEGPMAYRYPRISPDQSRLAVAVEGDIWSIDLVRGSRTRLTVDRGVSFAPFPTWTPDNRAVTFVGAAEPDSSNYALFSRAADASRAAEPLLVRPYAMLSTSWSPDGETLAYYETQRSGNARDLWTLSLSHGDDPSPFLVTPFNERAAAFSPDGRWVAYVSDASGQDEVYVRPFPAEAGGQETISIGGGTEPVWSPTRRELFYRSGTQMMAVDVGLGATFTAGRPYELFEDTYARDGSGALALPFYDVAADGERFVMVQPSEAQGLTSFTVVVNWFEELKRLVPIP